MIIHVYQVDKQIGIILSMLMLKKAKKELEWEAKLTIEDMVRDAWNFEKNLK